MVTDMKDILCSQCGGIHDEAILCRGIFPGNTYSHGWYKWPEIKPIQGQNILMWVPGANGAVDGGYIYDGCYIDGLFFTPDGEDHKPVAWMARPIPPQFKSSYAEAKQHGYKQQ